MDAYRKWIHKMIYQMGKDAGLNENFCERLATHAVTHYGSNKTATGSAICHEVNKLIPKLLVRQRKEEKGAIV